MDDEGTIIIVCCAKMIVAEHKIVCCAKMIVAEHKMFISLAQNFLSYINVKQGYSSPRRKTN